MKYLFIVFVLISCSKGGDKRLAEQEGIRAQEQVEANNDNQRAWAERMEADLNRRKYFLRAVEGEYEGEVDVEGVLFTISGKFIPSIPVEFYNRTRTLEEINYEIQNLNLNISIKIENPRISNSAVTCTVEGYKPDVINGNIYLISESCKNIFNLFIADSLGQVERSLSNERAREMARDIVSGALLQIEFLDGTFESSVSTKKYRFQLKRL